MSASTAGIGHAIAVQLLEDGANVIINGRNTKDVEQAVAALNKRFGRRAIGANLYEGNAGTW